MRSCKKNMLLRRLTVIAVTTSLLGGCNNSSPTEPKLGASIVGTWAGTYNEDYRGNQCDSSAQANFQETVDRSLSGTVSLPSCRGTFSFINGYLQGYTFTANVLDADLGLNPLRGILSGSSLEITMFNETGETTGQLHLHR